MSQMTVHSTECMSSGPGGHTQKLLHLDDKQVLSIIGSEYRLAKGELASYKLREINRKGLAKFLYTIVVWLEEDRNTRITRRAIKKGLI